MSRETEEDSNRLDWLESLIRPVSWRNKSWICRGGVPEIVPSPSGSPYPEGVTQPTAREAIDVARKKGLKID